MATITDLQNEMTGLTFRTTLNNNFDNLNNDKAETTHTHAGVYTPVADTTALDARVTTNEGDIATNSASITALEGLSTYDYATISNVTVTNDVYENILTLTTPIRDAGTYEIRMSQMYTLASTVNSAYFRFRVDGGTWVEVRREPKDVTDIVPMDYWKVISHVGGTITVEVESRKGNAADVLTILEMSAAVVRKV